MSQNPTETEEWKVALAPDNIATMTLDQLDAAYEEGKIGEDTLVWTDGMEEWLPLSEVAGGEDDAEEPAVAEPAVAEPTVAEPTVAEVPAAQPVADAGPAQAAAASIPAQSIPAQSAPLAAAPPAPAAVSTAPMAINTDLSFMDVGEDFGAGKSKKGKLGMFAAAAVVLAGVGLTAMNMSGGSEQDPAVAAALAQPVQAPAGGEEVAVAKKDDPNAPLTGGGYQVSAAEEKAFKKEQEQNAKLKAEMEKALEGSEAAGSSKKTKAKAAKGAMVRKYGGASKKRKKSQPFKKSKGKGNSFDPLNADLP